MPTNPVVDAWFAAYDHPLSEAVQAVRAVMLAADPRVTESIKWKAPTFEYKGNIASFYPKSKKHVALMFHQGALIPGDHPLLEGDGGTSRIARFDDEADVAAKAPQLRAIVNAWCALRDG